MIQSGLTAQLVGDVACSVSSTVPGSVLAAWDGQQVAISWLPDGWCPGIASSPAITITGPCVPLVMNPVQARFVARSGEAGFGDYTCTVMPSVPVLALTEVYLKGQ